MTGRRSFLGKVATAGVATVAGIAVVPSPPESAATVRGTPDDASVDDDVAHPWEETAITDEDASPIARYQYRSWGNSFEPTAPINIVFPLADHPEGLSTIVGVLQEAGWTAELEEYTRYAWDREAERYALQEASVAETYYGANGRAHVRCWEFEGVVSVQAHVDSAARPKHVIESYARGRRIVESLFRDAGWSISRGAIDLANDKAPDHDGYASVVVPGPDREELTREQEGST